MNNRILSMVIVVVVIVLAVGIYFVTQSNSGDADLGLEDNLRITEEGIARYILEITELEKEKQLDFEEARNLIKNAKTTKTYSGKTYKVATCPCTGKNTLANARIWAINAGGEKCRNSLRRTGEYNFCGSQCNGKCEVQYSCKFGLLHELTDSDWFPGTCAYNSEPVAKF